VSTEHPETTLARTRLAAMVDAGVEPTLAAEELTDLLLRNRTVDLEGYRPDHDSWTPSYMLGAAAQDGWLLKAGKAVARVDGADGGLRLSRSQLHAHCLAMADRYAMRRYATMPLARTWRGPELNVLNADGPGGMTVPISGGLEPVPGGATE